MSQLISRTAVFIKIGESVSGAFTIDGNPPTILQTSGDWTAADISFAGSGNLTGYHFIYDEEGVLVKVAGNSAVRITLPSQYLRDHKAIKLCSGTKAVPVAQADDRTLYLEVWTP
jgi:hypothetical protein